MRHVTYVTTAYHSSKYVVTFPYMGTTVPLYMCDMTHSHVVTFPYMGTTVPLYANEQNELLIKEAYFLSTYE